MGEISTMTEVGILWDCPKCNKAQQKLIRFHNNLVLTSEMLLRRRKEGNYFCKFCNFQGRYTKLGKTHFVNIQEKLSAEINRRELR